MRGGEALLPQGGHPEEDLAVVFGPQRLRLRYLESQAQPAGVHEGGEVVSILHVSAGLRRAGVDDAGERGPDLGALLVLPRPVALGARGVGGGPQPRGLAARAVHLLDGHELAREQRFPPLEVGLGPAPLGLGLLEAGLRALGFEPVSLGVDAGEDGLRRNAVALVEADLRHRTFDLGRDLHELLRLEGAEGLHLVGHVLNGHGGDPYGEGGPGSAGLSRSLALGAAAAGDGDARRRRRRERHPIDRCTLELRGRSQARASESPYSVLRRTRLQARDPPPL